MSIRLTPSILKTLKTWCARVTRSRITIAFLFAMLANYVAQMTLHSIVLSYYAQNRELVTRVIDAAGVQRGFTVVQPGVLRICSRIPTPHGTTCYTIYNSSAIAAPTNTLDAQCAEGLTWLENCLINSKSEEILYLVLESWLVVVSLIALMDESIPHLIVVASAQLVNTGWISYRIARDISANQTYDEMIVAGACGGFDILEGSWQYGMFYVTLGFSIAALLGMYFLVSKLIKLYSKSKLSSVGSPPVINRMLGWRLWMHVFLQFTAFFTLSSAAMWYDKRKSVTMASYYSTNVLYDVGFYTVAVIILPWLVSGTRSVSKENRLLFFVYTILTLVLLVISGLWFGSALFRYEYLDWRTFSCATTLADILLVITSILSVVCRLNFGNGLAHFLIVEQKLRASGFTRDTFLNDPGDTRKSSVNVKRVTAGPLSRPAIDQSQSSFVAWKHPPSMCPTESTVFSRWLAFTGGGDPEKCSLESQEERLAGTIVISEDDMSLYSAQSISDDGNNSLGGVDEKEIIVSWTSQI